MLAGVVRRLGQMEWTTMRQSGTATKYPGVRKLGEKRYRVRGKVKDERTGRSKEVDRVLKGMTARQAARRREELLAELADEGAVERERIGDCARSWIELRVPSTRDRKFVPGYPAIGVRVQGKSSSTV